MVSETTIHLPLSTPHRRYASVRMIASMRRVGLKTGIWSGVGLIVVLLLLIGPKMFRSLSSPNATIAPFALSPRALKSTTTTTFQGPLLVSSVNSRYFTDSSGKAIYLTGSHTWSNLVDNGDTDPPPAFDYDTFLDFLEDNNHNFFRLWTWEQAKWSCETYDEYWFYPHYFERLGPDTASDGKLKFDVDSLDDEYFTRLRDRVIAAGNRGIYVSIMLFNGWSIEQKIASGNEPFDGHPFNQNNNANGIDGDVSNNGMGGELHLYESDGSYWVPEVTEAQEAYVRAVVDAVNDLDNVLYEIANESHYGSTEWQDHFVGFIKSYEATLAKQHPIGMTAQYENGGCCWSGVNDSLFASDADWISPNDADPYRDVPPAATGDKVIITDTDHLWGIGGDRVWVWKSFTRGLNPIFMDAYDGAATGAGAPADWDSSEAQWVGLRRNLGYARMYAERADLINMVPDSSLSSTGYCLAKATSENAEYIVYQPEAMDSISIDLSATNATMWVEWFDPSTGDTLSGLPILGGAVRWLVSGTSGDAVAYIYDLSALPVEMGSISASVVDVMKVRLEWFTNSEVDNAGFNVLRKGPSETSFIRLPGGFVAGRGTSTSVSTYSYEDSPHVAGHYAYRIQQVNRTGFVADVKQIEVDLVVERFELLDNYPNPFNPTTRMEIRLSEEAHLRLAVVDASGRRVRRLLDGMFAAGVHRVEWNGRDDRGNDVAAGVYFGVLNSGKARRTLKMLLLR